MSWLNSLFIKLHSRNVTLEEHAQGQHTSTGLVFSSLSSYLDSEFEIYNIYGVAGSGATLSQSTIPSKSHTTKKRPGAVTEPLQNDEGAESEDLSSLGDFRGDAGRKLPDSDYKVVSNWPDASVKLGQATGVDFDTTGNVVVFHRGDRTWDSDTFDNQNAYKHRNLGPIHEDTVLIIHPTSGILLHHWGKDM